MRVSKFLVILLLLSSSAWGESQENMVKKANELFKKQQWDGAIDQYISALEQNKNADIVQYDLGTTFYKKGNYDQSIEHLQKSFSDKNKETSVRSYYNLGNALYKKGSSLENEKIEEAINFLQKSIESYDKTLKLNPKDKDAQYNHEYVQKELERLKKKKEEQSKEQQQQNQSSKNDQSKQDKNKGQNGQNKDQNQSQNSSNEENKKEDNKKSEENKQDKGQRLENSEEQKSENKEEQQAQPQEGKEQTLEQKQAKELLEDYERQDATKGLLNFVDRHKGESHVDRDW